MIAQEFTVLEKCAGRNKNLLHFFLLHRANYHYLQFFKSGSPFIRSDIQVLFPAQIARNRVGDFFLGFEVMVNGTS